MANPFVHVELGTTEFDKAKSFYRSLFDWQLVGWVERSETHHRSPNPLC
jgi:predicted enzyme related to lactoylglutathione lyase